jgi:hypothetical protein
LRSAIGVNDDDSFTRKALENACLNSLEDGLKGVGIVMGRQAHHDVYFAHVDELAKKVICQKGLFRQFNLRVMIKSYESKGARIQT